MKNTNILNEINRARQIWDYDKSKTIFEQTNYTGTTGTTNTGTTGGPTPTNVAMKPTITLCTGGTYSVNYGITLNGQNLTQADIGKTIIWYPSTVLGYGPNTPAQGTITSITPDDGSYSGGMVMDSNEQACPTTGGPTPTGGQQTYPSNYNPSSWFTTFLNNASSKPWYANRKCQFFANRIQLWTNQLQGAGPRKQNMLNDKINQVTMYAQQQPEPGCTNI